MKGFFRRALTLLFIVAFLIFFSANTTTAMVFSKPERIGHISLGKYGGFIFTDVTENLSEQTKLSKKKTKDKQPIMVSIKGVAQFGDSEDAIYFHYDYVKKWRDRIMAFGDKDPKNTINLIFEGYATVYKISNDEGKVFYLIQTLLKKDKRSFPSYVLLSRQNDGIFIKHFDTDDIATQNFEEYAKSTSDYINVDLKDCLTEKNIIAFPYELKRNTFELMSLPITEERGLFLFIWDDTTQSFVTKKFVFPSDGSSEVQYYLKQFFDSLVGIFR